MSQASRLGYHMQKIHTHYDNLKVSRDAPASVIKAAYRTLSQQYHPDLSAHPDAARIMVMLNNSYAVLRDEAQRRMHDDWIAAQEAQPDAVEPNPSPPPTQPQAEVPPTAPMPPAPRGLQAVPARLWVLLVMVIMYFAWLQWSRSISVDDPGYKAIDVGALQENEPASSSLPTGVIRASDPTESDAPSHTVRTATALPGQLKRRGNPQSAPSPHEDEAREASGHQRSVPDTATPTQAVERDDSNPSETLAPQATARFVLQVAAVPSQEKAAELQAKLRTAGISSYTQKNGELIKIKIGPIVKDEADKIRAKLGRIGLSGFIVPI
jgi:cell division septation protein DedD